MNRIRKVGVSLLALFLLGLILHELNDPFLDNPDGVSEFRELSVSVRDM